MDYAQEMSAVRDRVFGRETREVDHYPMLYPSIMPLGKLPGQWSTWWGPSRRKPHWYVQPLTPIR